MSKFSFCFFFGFVQEDNTLNSLEKEKKIQTNFNGREGLLLFFFFFYSISKGKELFRCEWKEIIS